MGRLRLHNETSAKEENLSRSLLLRLPDADTTKPLYRCTNEEFREVSVKQKIGLSLQDGVSQAYAPYRQPILTPLFPPFHVFVVRW
jgi:hypothetical protein